MRHVACRLTLPLLLVACGGDSTGPNGKKPDPPPERFSLTRVGDLVPGQAAHLYGTKLSDLSSLLLAGRAVDFTLVAENEVTFTVPELRACETDGRPVELQGNTTKLAAKMSVPDALTLEVGESRVLTAADLACLQISKEKADYVLSVTSLTSGRDMEPIFRLVASGATSSGTVITRSPRPLAPRLWGAPALSRHAMHFAEPIAPPSAAPPAGHRPSTGTDLERLFDPRLATAEVGDTVTLVDWSALTFKTTRENAPTYDAVVIVVSGKQVVLADTRVDGLVARAWRYRDWFERAAAATDRWAVPAIGAVINPGFTPLQTANGRMFHVLMDIPSLGSPRSDEARPITREPSLSSEIMMTMLSETFADPNYEGHQDQIASTMIHELAHVADHIPQMWGETESSVGWHAEALAVTVAEMAARLSTGMENDADPSRVDPALYRTLGEWPSSVAQRDSPFGDPDDPGSPTFASYDKGARMLLFARELLGEAGFAPAGPTLHQRLAARAFQVTGNTPEAFAARTAIWGIESLVAEVGMSVEEFIDTYTLAELTDDLIPAVAVERFSLPQIQTWDNTRPQNTVEDYYRIAGVLRERAEQHVMLRSQNTTVQVSVPGGAHHHWFIPAEEALGLTVEARDVTLQRHHRVRLTRLR